MPGVPYTFGTATANIPLLELDACFATNVTIGTSQVGLGNSINSLSGLVSVSTGNASTGNLIVNSGDTINTLVSGLFVPTDVSGAGLTLTVQRAAYMQIGTRVWVEITLTYPSNSNGNNAGIGMGSLPAAANVIGVCGMWMIYYGGANFFMGLMSSGSNAFNIYDSAENPQTNATLSGRGIRMQFNYSTV